MSSVLKPWVQELPWMMQGTMMTGIRGNDLSAAPKLKPVARWVRSLLLNNGNPENDFMDVPKLPAVEEFEDEIEYVSVHYFAHFIHTLEIIGYKHPDKEVRTIALDYYDRLVDFLHLLPEPEEHLDYRLSGEKDTTGSVRKWRSGERMAGKVLESLQVRALQRKIDNLESELKEKENQLEIARSYNIESHNSFGRVGS